MKRFTLGVITGASSLLVAVPLIAQISSAQSSSDAASPERPVPSQECLAALVAKEDAVLADMDAHIAQRKAAALAHRDALAAASTITDDVQRSEAFRAAQEAFRASMENMDDADMQAIMDAVREACGDTFGFRGMFHQKGPHGMGGRGLMGRPMIGEWMHDKHTHDDDDDDVEVEEETSDISTQE